MLPVKGLFLPKKQEISITFDPSSGERDHLEKTDWLRLKLNWDPRKTEKCPRKLLMSASMIFTAQPSTVLSGIETSSWGPQMKFPVIFCLKPSGIESFFKPEKHEFSGLKIERTELSRQPYDDLNFSFLFLTSSHKCSTAGETFSMRYAKTSPRDSRFFR